MLDSKTAEDSFLERFLVASASSPQLAGDGNGARYACEIYAIR